MAEAITARSLPFHGGQLRAIAEQFSVPVDRLLDFSASIYPDGPSRRVVEALLEAVRSPEQLRQYPDLESTELREHLAAYTRIPAANILVSNGVAPLIAATLRAIGTRKCLLPMPAFGEYRRILQRESIDIETYPLAPDLDFHPDLERLFACCVECNCDTVILTNPHNPSGSTIDTAEIRSILEFAAQSGIRILLDEAFIDFVPEHSISSDVLTNSHLIVFRSLTKFFAMAGLRVAYAVAPNDLVPQISALLDPWPVSTLASIAACAAVEDRTSIDATILRNSDKRTWLSHALGEMGLMVFPGRANFLLFRVPHELRNTGVWEELIIHHGIVLRNCATFEGLDESYMRTAVHGREDNQRLIRALSSLIRDRRSDASSR